MAGVGGFLPAAFRFLRDLARNQREGLFEANRDVYERRHELDRPAELPRDAA